MHLNHSIRRCYSSLPKRTVALVRQGHASNNVRFLAVFASNSEWNRSSFWGFGAGAAAGAAAIALTSSIAWCEKAETKQPPVDYDQVRKDISNILDNDSHDDGSYGPVVVRLAWHASGTYDKKKCNKCPGGSNGATMRFKPECDFGANAGLGIARQVLDPIKAKHPGISYADLWTLAGVVAIEHMGGPVISWRPGRTDAADGSACPPDGRLPDPTKGPAGTRETFYRMGFNDKEIVALLGAHALGRCHKNASGYTGRWTNAPTTFSNEFFRLLLEEKWTEKKWSGPKQYEDKTGTLMMLPSDLDLVEDPKFRKYVEMFAKDEDLFFKEFSKAFNKLMELGVKFPCQGFFRCLWAYLFGWCKC